MSSWNRVFFQHCLGVFEIIKIVPYYGCLLFNLCLFFQTKILVFVLRYWINNIKVNLVSRTIQKGEQRT